MRNPCRRQGSFGTVSSDCLLLYEKYHAEDRTDEMECMEDACNRRAIILERNVSCGHYTVFICKFLSIDEIKQRNLIWI